MATAGGDGAALAGRKHALSGALRAPGAAAGAPGGAIASSAGSGGASGAENGVISGSTGGEMALDDEEEGEEAEDEAAAGDAGEEQQVKPGAVARRVRLTLGQKREVVDLAASKKFTHRELAQKFRVGRTTITNICRQEDLIRTETDSADATKKRRKTTKCTYDLRVLDECLHKWRMEVRVSSPDTKLTGTVLQQKAMDIACKILRDPFAELPDRVSQALSKFSASNGWLDGYRTRFGSFSSKHHSHHSGGGEYNSAIKNVDVQTRLRELHLSFQSVELQDIWAGSEFALMFNPASGSAGANVNNISEVGVNGGSIGRSAGNDNGRLTVSLFVSAAGETFDLQVIGTDRSPVALRGVDTQRTYRVHYGYSKTGWQVAHTTVAMLKALNARARARKRTFRVILDSAVPHVKAAMMLDSQGDQRTFFVYDHIQIYFLPPNFKPPRFHPCHLGLVQAFKARFRCELVEATFGKYRQSVMMHQQQQPAANHLLNLPRILHTRNVLHWLHVALESLDKDLIQQCWLHSGLLPTQMLATLNTEMAASVQTAAFSTSNVPIASLSTAGLPSAQTLCQDLQTLLVDISPVAPEFIRWLGAPPAGSIGESSTVVPNAIAYTEMEGNAAVTDPGIDEVQLIRSVLQKHGMLSTTRLDEQTHPEGQSAFLDDAATEQVPRREEVLMSIDILKKYLRLTDDSVSNRVQAIVELNRVKSSVRSAAMRDASC